jgi:hypothetical protein
MTIATQSGSLIVKDGKIAENCGCCAGWYCYCKDLVWPQMGFSFQYNGTPILGMFNPEYLECGSSNSNAFNYALPCTKVIYADFRPGTDFERQGTVGFLHRIPLDSVEMPFGIGTKTVTLFFEYTVFYGFGAGPPLVYCLNTNRVGYKTFGINWYSSFKALMFNYDTGPFKSGITELFDYHQLVSVQGGSPGAVSDAVPAPTYAEATAVAPPAPTGNTQNSFFRRPVTSLDEYPFTAYPELFSKWTAREIYRLFYASVPASAFRVNLPAPTEVLCSY